MKTVTNNLTTMMQNITLENRDFVTGDKAYDFHEIERDDCKFEIRICLAHLDRGVAKEVGAAVPGRQGEGTKIGFWISVTKKEENKNM